jgi:hypothetical protein
VKDLRRDGQEESGPWNGVRSKGEGEGEGVEPHLVVTNRQGLYAVLSGNLDRRESHPTIRQSASTNPRQRQSLQNTGDRSDPPIQIFLLTYHFPSFALVTYCNPKKNSQTHHFRTPASSAEAKRKKNRRAKPPPPGYPLYGLFAVSPPAYGIRKGCAFRGYRLLGHWSRVAVGEAATSRDEMGCTPEAVTLSAIDQRAPIPSTAPVPHTFRASFPSG